MRLFNYLLIAFGVGCFVSAALLLTVLIGGRIRPDMPAGTVVSIGDCINDDLCGVVFDTGIHCLVLDPTLHEKTSCWMYYQ